jgi:hypothetical protein
LCIFIVVEDNVYVKPVEGPSCNNRPPNDDDDDGNDEKEQEEEKKEEKEGTSEGK